MSDDNIRSTGSPTGEPANSATATPAGPNESTRSLSHLHPDNLRLGGTGVFAGDWSQTQAADGAGRYPVGFVGVLVDTWNGWAVFQCTRDVAEAIVAEQQRLREAEHARLRAEGLTGQELTDSVDEALAQLVFDGDDIVVTAGGDDGLGRFGPDPDGQYVVNGWNWTWTAVDPAVCDRIAGELPPAGQHQRFVLLTHAVGMRVPHDRLRVTSLEQIPTHNGVAFTATLTLDDQIVGTVENSGNGGATMYYAASRAFTWRDMDAYAGACRRSGEPVSTEQVLEALVDEYDFDQAVGAALAEGGTVARLLDNDGYVRDFATVSPVPGSATQDASLARHLAESRPHPAGDHWQIWSGATWRYLGSGRPVAGPGHPAAPNGPPSSTP